MTGPEIEALVSGTTVEIDTPLGKTVSVRYIGGGRLSGQAGDLGSYLGARSDNGRWWVEDNRLCNKWLTWFNAEPQCLTLTKAGGKIQWQNQAGTTGTATIVADATPKTAPANGLSSTRMSLAGPKPAKPQMAASKPDETKQPKTYRVANVEAGDVLNVRGGPSADDDVVAELDPDTADISMTGECRHRWCAITHGAISGWVNVAFLEPDAGAAERSEPSGIIPVRARAATSRSRLARDSRDAPRTCLTEPARALLDTIERRFGPVRVVSTCRPGARIAGTGKPSRHASGNAVDFDAGGRKSKIVDWLVANHKGGGTMTYPDMDHIHVDVGRHFVSLAGRGRRVSRGRGPDVAAGSRDSMGL